MPGRGLVGPGEFKIAFRNGGETRFLMTMSPLLQFVRDHPPLSEEERLAREPIPMFVATGENHAFVDPNDPMLVYIPTPQVEEEEKVVAQKEEEEGE